MNRDKESAHLNHHLINTPGKPKSFNPIFFETVSLLQTFSVFFHSNSTCIQNSNSKTAKILAVFQGAACISAILSFSCTHRSFILGFSSTTLEFGFKNFLFPPFLLLELNSFLFPQSQDFCCCPFPIPCTETFPKVVHLRNSSYLHILLIFRGKRKEKVSPWGLCCSNRSAYSRTLRKHVLGSCFKYLCERKMKKYVRFVQISKHQSREATETLGLAYFLLIK